MGRCQSDLGSLCFTTRSAWRFFSEASLLCPLLPSRKGESCSGGRVRVLEFFLDILFRASDGYSPPTNDRGLRAAGSSLRMTATAAQLQALLAPPNPSDSQRHAQQLLSSALAAPIVPTKLGSLLSPLLTSESERAQALSSQLAESNSAVSTLVQNTKSRLADVLCRTTELRSAHEVLEDALIDHREALVSSFSQREQEGEGHVGGTLRERLQGLSEKRKELELARDWFSVLAKTEELG